MSSFNLTYDGFADAIITNAIVVSDKEQNDVGCFPPHFYTDCAAWDTGSQFTLISPRIVEKLHLTPYREGGIMGIGGKKTVKTYKIAIGLPNGILIHDVEVYCSDLDDYDMLIGMDIITMTDFCITNADLRTKFSFRIPSEGGFDF